MANRLGAASLLAASVALLAAGSPRVVQIKPVVATAPVSADSEDPAIWINVSEPSQSLVLGTNKSPSPHGALVVFGLDGRVRQTLDEIGYPNNVDVEYGLNLAGESTDIAVVTEREGRRLLVFRIPPDGHGLSDVSSVGRTNMFVGESGERATPMGIALYRRPRDGAVFAFISRKAGPRAGYLWQYRLEDDGHGRVQAVKVREFGRFSGRGEIEAVAIDDALGYVYYADERGGIHKWRADPDHPQAHQELALFGQVEFSGHREGIAVYPRSDGSGYLICTDQVKGNSEYHVYAREGSPGQPHDHTELLKVIRGGADSTDGIEVTSAALGPRFPHGLLVAMNSHSRNFLFYRWQDIATTGKPLLKVGAE